MKNKLNKIERERLMLSVLRGNARMKLTDLSRLTKIPVSTLFEKINDFKQKGIIKKFSADLNFESLGFHSKAIILLATTKKNSTSLLDFLRTHPNINNLHKVNNGYGYCVEVIFPRMVDVEKFLDKLESLVKITKKKVFYIVEEMKKEEFLAKNGYFNTLNERKNLLMN